MSIRSVPNNPQIAGRVSERHTHIFSTSAKSGCFRRRIPLVFRLGTIPIPLLPRLPMSPGFHWQGIDWDLAWRQQARSTAAYQIAKRMQIRARAIDIEVRHCLQDTKRHRFLPAIHATKVSSFAPGTNARIAFRAALPNVGQASTTLARSGSRDPASAEFAPGCAAPSSCDSRNSLSGLPVTAPRSSPTGAKHKCGHQLTSLRQPGQSTPGGLVPAVWATRWRSLLNATSSPNAPDSASHWGDSAVFPAF